MYKKGPPSLLPNDNSGCPAAPWFLHGHTGMRRSESRAPDGVREQGRRDDNDVGPPPGLGARVETADVGGSRPLRRGEVRTTSVFLSHTTAGNPFVRIVAGDIAASGSDVWIDDVEIREGYSLI